METRHLVKLSYYIQKQWIETRKITINQIESACSLFWGVSTFCQYKTDQRVDYRWIGRVFLKIRNTSNRSKLGYQIWKPEEVEKQKKDILTYILDDPKLMMLELDELICPLTQEQVGLLFYLVSEFKQIDWNNPSISIDGDLLQLYKDHISTTGKKIVEMIRKKIPDEISVKIAAPKINKKKAGPISLKDLAPVQKDKRRKGEISIGVDQKPPDPLLNIPDVENVSTPSVVENEPIETIVPVDVEKSEPVEIEVETVEKAPVEVENIEPVEIEVETVEKAPVEVENIEPVETVEKDPVEEEKSEPSEIKVETVEKAPVEVEEKEPVEIEVETVEKAPVEIEVETVEITPLALEEKKPVEIEVETVQTTAPVEKKKLIRKETKIVEKSTAKKSKEKTKKSNPWIDHVRKFRLDHPDLSYREAIQQAKHSYKKK